MSPNPTAADLVLHHGRVRTVDAEGSTTEAVAVSGDRILAVGSNDEMEVLADADTRRVHLNGRTVLPGFFDAHAHAMSIGINLAKVDLSAAASIGDVLQGIAERARQTPRGEWIEIAPTWHESTLSERRLPTRQELDSVVPDHPVYVPRGTRFFAVTNSAGFRAAGIDASVEDPPGGQFERDASGELTGRMFNPPAFDQVRRLLPPVTHDTLVRAIRAANRAFNAVGLTSIIDPALGAAEIRAYQDLWDRHELRVRTTGIVAPDHSVPLVSSADELMRFLDGFAPRSGFGDAFFRIGPFKLWIDGFIETAWLKEGYANDSDFHGVQAVPRDVMLHVLRKANELGWQVAVHAVGDAALEQTMDVFEELHHERSLAGRRWTLMHALFPTEKVLEACRRMDVHISVQQGLSYAFGDSMVKCWGQRRAAFATPHRVYLDRGFRLAGGSDVVPFNPLVSMWSTITRETRAAGVLGREQGATRAEALRMYSINPSYLTFEEHVKGSIEPGKLADLVVLSDDPLTCPEPAIKDLQILATILGGNLVHGQLEDFPSGGPATTHSELESHP
jgi:predicted amidohydrolase YtcJ